MDAAVAEAVAAVDIEDNAALLRRQRLRLILRLLT